jgi:hypothetical protein
MSWTGVNLFNNKLKFTTLWVEVPKDRGMINSLNSLNSLKLLDEEVLTEFGPEIEAETDEEDEEDKQPRIFINEALHAPRKLRLNEEQQDTPIGPLDRHDRVIIFRKSSGMLQSFIRSFFLGIPSITLLHSEFYDITEERPCTGQFVIGKFHSNIGR